MSALLLASKPLTTAAFSPQPLSEDRIERSAVRIATGSSSLAASAAETGDAPGLNDAVLAMVAHELRGPLAPLRFAAQLIRRTCADQPDALRALDVIERQITQIDRLAEDLLDATRVGHHALRLTKIRTSVGDVTTDVLAAARLTAAKRQAGPARHLPGRGPCRSKATRRGSRKPFTICCTMR